MNLDQQVKNVASQGRYGDSMLLHVNPAEVRGLSQVAPITVNPQTGQPEAFLPFLAPLLGAFALPAMASASGLGALSGLTGLAGSALGSGLAQWAATGDVKKGLLAGLTGYGIGKALQGAGAAAEGAKAAADQTAALTDTTTQTLLQNPNLALDATTLNPQGIAQLNTELAQGQGGINYAGQAAADAYQGVGAEAIQDAFSGGFNPGLQNVAAGISQPQALVPITGGMLPTAMMESQEAYNQDVLRWQEEEEESRRQNFLMNPENSLYAQGGMTELDQGLQMDANLLSNPMGQGVNAFSTGGLVPGITDEGNIVGTRTAQRFAPARKAYAVNPDYMAGFQPETMYFQPSTLNQPATGLTEGGAPKPVDDYMGTRGGYGGPSMSMGASQVIDPYAAYTGPAPEGLIQGASTPLPQGMSYDIPLDTTTESPATTESEPVLYDEPLPFVTPGGTQVNFLGGIDANLIPGIPGVGQGYVSDFDSADQMQTLDYSDYPNRSDYGSSEDGGHLEFKQAQNEWFQSQIPSVNIPGQTSGITNVDTGSMVGPMLPPGTVPPMPPPVDIGFATADDIEAGKVSEPVLAPHRNRTGYLDANPNPPLMAITPPMPPPVMHPPPAMQLPPVMQPPMPPPVITPPKRSDFGSSDEGGHIEYKDSLRDYYTAYPGGVPGFYGNPNLGGIYQGFAEGGDTGDKKREEVKKKAVGGMIESPVTEAPLQAAEQANDLMQDPVTQETIQFILGETDNQQVVNDFISKYGTEMFLQLRDSVLKSLVPDAQTEGLIEGQGQSGMADDIPGRIGADEKIAVSQDEFIVPADVVSSLGDGSSDAGSNRLYEMMDRVRQAKTGGTTQPPMLDLNKVMPA